jgi:hypothetical protein
MIKFGKRMVSYNMNKKVIDSLDTNLKRLVLNTI